jgi:hypothetical protein
MPTKKQNATKALEILETAWKTKSAILLTDDYAYMIFQTAPGKWQETSFIFNDGSLEVRELDAEKALMLFIEEVTTGLPGYNSYTVVTDNDTKAKVVERIKAVGG